MTEGSRHVWYVSYGSNMWSTRLDAYLAGGTPPGGRRANPGARDRTPPLRSVAIDLPGTTYFAGSSPQWGGGGVAFYDHATPGFTAARAYLLTAGQLADVAAQEMYRLPVEDDPIEQVVLTPLADGRHTAGPGRYETLVEVGSFDERPLLTFTSPHGTEHVAHRRPSEAYLDTLRTGLRESRDWHDQQIEAYLATILPSSSDASPRG